MTHTHVARFRYPLQVLISKHGWDVDTLSAELMVARQALKVHELEVARLQQALLATNRSLSTMRGDGAVLDLTRERVLINFRQIQEDAIQAQENQLRSATLQCEQILDQVNRARRMLQGFEKHSDRLRSEHIVETGRIAARDADDAWLVARAWQGVTGE